MSGVATSASNSRKAPLDLLHEVLRADLIRARLFGFLGALARSDHRDALGLARAVRQDDRAAHHLIRVLRVDAEQHRDVHGLVELGVLQLAHQTHGVRQRVGARLDFRLGRRVLLSGSSHRLLSSFKRFRWSGISDCSSFQPKADRSS
jgi:hypothetical protein